MKEPDMPSNDLTIIILTFNESLHVKRAIESARKVAQEVIIVDSFSTDDTCSIAESLGAKVVQHKFVNQAQQFQWAMDQGIITTPWTMRLDADEYLTEELISEINTRLSKLPSAISGVELKRRVYFMDRWIRHGGYYPTILLRLWRTGDARIEQRWMDEHTFLTRGKSIVLEHDLIDDNLHTLTWWTEKHNHYATREAVDILRQKYGWDAPSPQEQGLHHGGQASRKRWYKNNLYLRMPLFLRAFLYFQYRYWIKLGFLDGRKGLIWHFLQGFWYRFLVDAKITQMEWWVKKEQKDIQTILKEKFNLKP